MLSDGGTAFNAAGSAFWRQSLSATQGQQPRQGTTHGPPRDPVRAYIPYDMFFINSSIGSKAKLLA